ncbi:SET domain-containing protein-lysine N-methyltransferase [Dyella sp. LX-66]|uniref:SET domain-containing protein-lysine N-methyltransferase n=1 Tax=unclassified Dyella TaxID=2634549 RepID=UPI001BE0653F|nr:MULTISPECIES: SET domain-containing protein [unclassified Dyella]MBT2118697.1 SET domain-containing protein-lysine N-methyltransferase [Dyella sp. LX-1]MBT2141046.1 SET domain-containing protein-lysine N-methyltransferase [Dyella sp. LX-66]
MILPRYRIAASGIGGAGKGLFLEEDVAAGRIVTAPDAIDRTWSLAQITASPELQVQLYAAARWFEDRYTLSPDWPDECYINHSFEPNGLWHLGFVFAARDLPAGTEITVDYRHLLAPGQEEDFIDSATGEKIIGLSWADSLTTSTRALASLLAGAAI